MDDKKNKKKTLTISTNFSKKIDISSLGKGSKKSFSISKKKPFRPSKNNPNLNLGNPSNKQNFFKKNLNRKFIEQQATKAFIKKDEKPQNKGKIKLKSSIDRRNLKLTVSRALNVEEIEIKQSKFSICKKSKTKRKKEFTY